MQYPTQKSLMSPNILGSEIEENDLDKILVNIKIIANKLTKIRACSNENDAKIATNSLWTLHWGLSMLLKFMNQKNIELLNVHLKGINDYANRVIKEDKDTERDYMKTLLEMRGENYVG